MGRETGDELSATHHSTDAGITGGFEFGDMNMRTKCD